MGGTCDYLLIKQGSATLTKMSKTCFTRSTYGVLIQGPGGFTKYGGPRFILITLRIHLFKNVIINII